MIADDDLTQEQASLHAYAIHATRPVCVCDACPCVMLPHVQLFAVIRRHANANAEARSLCLLLQQETAGGVKLGFGDVPPFGIRLINVRTRLETGTVGQIIPHELPFELRREMK